MQVSGVVSSRVLSVSYFFRLFAAFFADFLVFLLAFFAFLVAIRFPPRVELISAGGFTS